MSYRFKLLISYFKCLNPVKIMNFLLLRAAYCLSKLTGKTILWGKPFAVTFETVSGCNLQCPGCETGIGLLNREAGLIDTEQFKVALNKLPSSVFHINLHAQGEPLMHKDIEHFIRLARQRHMFVSMSTNGTLLDEPTAKALINSRLNHIIISLDGFDQDSYGSYRIGGDFNSVVHNAERLISLRRLSGKKAPLVEIQTVVTRYNENHLNLIKSIAKKIKADHFTMKTAYVPDLSSPPDYYPTNNNHQRYHTNENGTLISIKKTPRFCFRQRSSLVVLNNMDVIPCCFDKHADWKLGNLITEEFESIYNNKKSLQFQKMLRSKKPPIICNNCI